MSFMIAVSSSERQFVLRMRYFTPNGQEIIALAASELLHRMLASTTLALLHQVVLLSRF